MQEATQIAIARRLLVKAKQNLTVGDMVDDGYHGKISGINYRTAQDNYDAFVWLPTNSRELEIIIEVL